MLIPLFLWNMGIRAEVQYFYYTKHCYYSTQTEIESEMIRNLGELTYMNYKEKCGNNSKQKHYMKTVCIGTTVSELWK